MSSTDAAAQTLQNYAREDAISTGLAFPEGLSNDKIVEFLNQAGDLLFMPGDPNLDNQKRNISIQVFLRFSPEVLFNFANLWLERWSVSSAIGWHKEWSQIVDRRDAAELTDILLSSHQDRTRQRLSMPFAQLLGFGAVLKIKRGDFHEEI